jgi:surface antigen
LALLLVAAMVVGVSSDSALAKSEGGGNGDEGRPHRQSLAGPPGSAGVEIVKAPFLAGKGGGADPGDDYPSRWKNRPRDSVLDQWKEYNRECTSFAAWALHSRNGYEMPFHRNANRWGPLARRLGFLVNSRPNPGSVAWSNAGTWGHVAYVVAVNGGNVTVEEYNYAIPGGYDKRVVSVSAFTGFIHFRDPATVGITPASVLEAPEPVVSETFSETTGGIANTWSNYTTATEGQGPSLLSGMTVQVSCAVTGFKVSDGNTWWYRIASSPWSNAFYATADAFYNNGQTSGSLIGTPFVDPAVHAC